MSCEICKQKASFADTAKKHIGYMGYTMQLKAMYEGTAREIANEIEKARAPMLWF